MQGNQNTTADQARHTAEQHYRQGNEYFRRGDWKEAIQHYMAACDAYSESPAMEKLKMVYSILDFYNKDIYGQ